MTDLTLIAGHPLFVWFFLAGATIFVLGSLWNVSTWLKGKNQGIGSIIIDIIKTILSRKAALLIKTFILEALLFKREWGENKVRWLMKAAILWGYIVILIAYHLKVDIIHMPGFEHVGILMGILYAPFCDAIYLPAYASGVLTFTAFHAFFGILDNICMALILLVGEFIAIYRRFIAKAFMLKTTLEDKIAVMLLGSWFVFRFLAESVTILAYSVPDSIAQSWFIAYGISKVIAPLSLDWNFWYGVLWPLSSLFLGLLVASIPFNKKLWHIFAMPAAILVNAAKFRSLEEGKEKRIPFCMKQMIELDACVKCQICLDHCTVYAITKDGSHSFASRNYRLRNFLKGMFGIFRKNKPNDEEMKKLSDDAYKCTLCGKCKELCPALINTRDLGISTREYIVKQKKHPKNFNLVLEGMEKTHNVANFPNEERAMWVEFMDSAPDDFYQRDKAEVVYFVGCLASFSPAIQDIPEKMVNFLEKIDVDFTIMGEEEYCCGYPMIVAGMRDEKVVDEMIEHNIKEVIKRGAKTVLFGCPSCLHTWEHEYKKRFEKRGYDIELLHHTQFLKKLIDEGKIKFKNLDLKVTYHDPCDLGRNSRIFDEPREVIKSIPGIEFVEMANNKELALCCGGGGDLEIVDEKLPGEIAKVVIDEAKKTGASVLVTACQQCKRSLAGAAKKEGGIEVLDILELINRASASDNSK